MESMESVVICPNCGKQVAVVLNQYSDELLKIFASMGIENIGKTDHFEGENKCKCGCIVVASIHVTAAVK